MSHIEQDNALGSALWDVLVLTLLRVGEVIVLVEYRPSVDRVCFFITGLNDPNASIP